MSSYPIVKQVGPPGANNLQTAGYVATLLGT
jgi:hypothetical protein